MNKNRLETLSDGVFAIVMMVLIFDFRLPGPHAGVALAQELQRLIPVFLTYAVSFIVLDMFWVAHNALFHIFIKNVNRIMIQLNMTYLAILSFVPFSAHVVGAYPHTTLAIIVYGFNIFLLGIMNYAMLRYALASDEIDTAHVSSRTIKKATIRMIMTPIMTALGMVMTFVSIPTALFLYAFPICFNLIPGPGVLDWIEKRFGLDFGPREPGK
jgi:uncharacterized membrane protein